MINTDKYEGLTIDDWYKMNHHDWKDVVNEHNDLLAEVKRLREDNKKLHDAINGCAYRGSEGSALDLYCESIIERCPTCYQNIDDMECGCEEE